MMPRAFGHKRGVDTVREIARAARDMGLEALTLYAFSSENWKRPADEISDLMGMLRTFIRSDLEEFVANNVRLRIIGDYQVLAPDIVELIDDAMARTAANDGTTLAIALNYGSQQEIARAAARDVAVLRQRLQHAVDGGARHPAVARQLQRRRAAMPVQRGKHRQRARHGTDRLRPHGRTSARPQGGQVGTKNCTCRGPGGSCPP
jgi:hypothetical protein